MSEIHTFDIDVNGRSSDYGQIYTVRCPACHTEIQVAELDLSGRPKCTCGYIWSVSVVAYGYKDDME